MVAVATTPMKASPSSPEGEPLRRLTFPALGTSCEVQYVAPNGPSQAFAFEQAVREWVTRFEAKYSRFRADSLISRINAAAGHDWVEIDADAENLFQICEVVYRTTEGIIDPTALPLLRLWDYKAAQPRIPSIEEVAIARASVGWFKVQRERGRIRLPQPGMALDLGGIGKEYAVDVVTQIALQRGITAALVDFGHDLRGVGAPPGRVAWHVGLEDPKHPGVAAGTVALSDRAIASSGDYLRCFHHDGKRYGHIVDPRTGCPVANGCLQATVIAPTCLQAGVLSTAAFVLGPTRGLELIQSCPGAEGLILTDRARAQTRAFYTYVAS